MIHPYKIEIKTGTPQILDANGKIIALCPSEDIAQWLVDRLECGRKYLVNGRRSK